MVIEKLDGIHADVRRPLLRNKAKRRRNFLKNTNIVPETNYYVKNTHMKYLLIVSVKEIFYRPFLTN